MAVEVSRLDLSPAELRSAARRAQDVSQARRLLALALVLEGASRTEAARAGGMDRQTLRDWGSATTRQEWKAWSTVRGWDGRHG